MDVFAANDLCAFNITAGAPSEDTTAGRFDATYCNKGISFGGPSGTAGIKSPQFINPATGATVALTDAWAHVEYGLSGSNSTGIALELSNSAGVPVARINCTSDAGVMRPEYWNGAAWVTTAATFTTGNSVIATLDLHVVCGASGTIDMYVNGSLKVTITGLNAAVNNLAFVGSSGAGAVQARTSQYLVSDQNTVGAKVSRLTPTANGANTAWANDYLNVDELGNNDATLISSATLGDKESYVATDATLPSAQYFVSSVFFNVRARLNSSGAANIKPLMRIGGVDYAGAYNFGALSSVAFGPSIAAFATDPSTGAAWSGVANLNAAEIGFQTAA